MKEVPENWRLTRSRHGDDRRLQLAQLLAAELGHPVWDDLLDGPQLPEGGDGHGEVRDEGDGLHLGDVGVPNADANGHGPSPPQDHGGAPHVVPRPVGREDDQELGDAFRYAAPGRAHQDVPQDKLQGGPRVGGRPAQQGQPADGSDHALLVHVGIQVELRPGPVAVLHHGHADPVWAHVQALHHSLDELLQQWEAAPDTLGAVNQEHHILFNWNCKEDRLCDLRQERDNFIPTVVRWVTAPRDIQLWIPGICMEENVQGWLN